MSDDLLLKIDAVSLSYDGRPILRDVHAEIRRPVGHRTGHIVGFLGPSGVGKCLARGTNVLMFAGSVKPVEELTVGDQLMGPDSQPRTVLSLANGRDEMYDIQPTKGDAYRVNGPHLLSLHIGKSKRSRARIDNISVDDYRQQSRTYKIRAKGYRVAVEFAAQNLPLDPYFLGLWLGDGDSDSPTITNPDIEVVEAIQAFARKTGAELSTYSNPERCNRYRLHNDWTRTGSLLALMRSLEVLDNKHIPLIYKANSRSARLELLAGLIDSDGSAIHGCYDLISKFPTLAEDVCYVARSLGFAAYINPCEKHSQSGKKGQYYRVTISGKLSELPVRIARKKLPPRRQIKNVLHVGLTVLPAGAGEYFGFEIDGDGLFLLADFTVTHNTQLFKIIAGLHQPDKGAVMIASEFDSTLHPVTAGEVGVVAQNYPLFAHRTVFGNLLIPARRSHHNQPRLAIEEVAARLDQFGLSDQAQLYPVQLSGGQRQRVAILQMILSGSRFILMDEPFSGLDMIMLEKTCQTIFDMADHGENRTIIIVTHDITAAASIADHIWLLGHERDDQDKAIPGARVVETYDLLARGLRYTPGIITQPVFLDTVREIKERFRTL